MTIKITVSVNPIDSVAAATLGGDAGFRIATSASVPSMPPRRSFHPIDLVDDTKRSLTLGSIAPEAKIIIVN